VRTGVGDARGVGLRLKVAGALIVTKSALFEDVRVKNGVPVKVGVWVDNKVREGEKVSKELKESAEVCDCELLEDSVVLPEKDKLGDSVKAGVDEGEPEMLICKVGY